MENIKIRSLGPIKEADINFGDLTFFVGPQASGKSIVLQLIKLLVDRTEIERMLKNYGFVWGENLQNNMERVFGEGMAGLWTNRTDVLFDDNNYFIDFLTSIQNGSNQNQNYEELLYIPAQRVLCLNNGWPRFFNDFDDSAPFVLREFSELLRLYLEFETAQLDEWLPQKSINDIFLNGLITIDRRTRKQLMLEVNGAKLPFMAWSSGQKEFFPLAVSLDMLTRFKPGQLSKVNSIIIEEPEMGLHPDAIKSIILQIVNLMNRGYKVIVSTHSPIFLEFAWAFNILKAEKAPSSAFESLLDLDQKNKSDYYFDNDLIKKSINTYYFDRNEGRVIVKNISSLDAGNEDLAISEWGGLSSFASKATDIVSTIAANNG